MRAKKNHKVGKSKEKEVVTPKSKSMEKSECDQHNEKLNLWCNQCKTLICAVCTHAAKHKGHNVMVFDEAREVAQTELENILKMADDVYSLHLKLTKVLEDSSAQIEAYKSASQEIHTKFQELLDKVTLKRDQLLADLNVARNTETSPIQKELKIHRIERSNLEHGLQFGKDVQKLRDNTEFFGMLSVALKSIRIPTLRPFKHASMRWGPTSLSSIVTEVEKISLAANKSKIGKTIQGIVTTMALKQIVLEPLRIAVSTKGDLYVVCQDNIEMISKEGNVKHLKKLDEYSGVAVDSEDCLYIAHSHGHKILKVREGVDTILAGSGTPGFMDGFGEKAKFSYPMDIMVNGKGILIVSDTFNHSVRKITPQGEVSTVGGNGKRGFSDGKSSNSMFSEPSGTAFDSKGNLFVCDSGNHLIRKITPGGMVSTHAGSEKGFQDGIGTHAKFDDPGGVAVDDEDILFVCDANNHRIRKITPEGIVSTIAGSEKGFADGAGTKVMFNQPAFIARDADGTLYVTDMSNHTIRVIV